jgi:hypothetical protein
MPLQTSGAISLANVATEFGGATPHSLSEYYAGGGLVPAGTSGTNGAVPSSGQIALSNFYGTSNVLKYVAVGYTNSTSGTAQQNRRIYTITSSGWGSEISTGLNFQNYTNQNPIAVTSDYKIIAVGEDSIPRIVFIPMTTAGAGTPLANPTYPDGPPIGGQMHSNKFSNDKLTWAAQLNRADSDTYHVWSFNSSTGIGTRYTNPPELPYGSSSPAGRNASFGGIAFHPNSNVIAFSCGYTYSGTASTVLFYPWSSSGFGTKYSQDILSVIDNEYPTSIKWSPDGNFFIVSISHSNGNAVRTYNWSNSSGIGSLVTTPANPDSDQFWPRVPHFFKSGDKVLLGREVYNWSGSTGYGSLVATLSSGYDGASQDHQNDISVDGDFVIMKTNISQFFQANSLPFNLIPFNNSTGFGTVLAKPSIPEGSLTASGITAKFGKV